MNSLIIGSSSQLAQYFPKEYERIDSHFIKEGLPLPLKTDFYDRIFICIAEQRTFLDEKGSKLFDKTNVDDTRKLVSFLSPKCNKLVVYGTAELWNNYDGAINIDMPFKYNHTPYILSKERMSLSIHDARFYGELSNVIILHPVNFNSVYRKSGFLFSKIFDSIINKKKIEIGDTYFYRDLVHPKYVAEKSMAAEKDEIIGSGRLIFVNDFIRNLYCAFKLNYEDYVTENLVHNLSIIRKTYYLQSIKCLYPYENLLFDTMKDIQHARVQNKIGE